MTRTPINRLLNTKMNRKEFLAHTGATVMMLTGISGLIKALTLSTPERTAGYGSSAYGGAQSSVQSSTRPSRRTTL